jgi:hypothetical protein
MERRIAPVKPGNFLCPPLFSGKNATFGAMSEAASA